MDQKETIFNSVPKMNYSENAVETSATEFKKVVESRRSVRVYDGSPIPEQVVRDCLDCALLAPNSSNLQPWEFYWVRDREKRERVVEACFSQPAARTAAEIFVSVARTATWKRNRDQMLELLYRQGDRAPKAAVHYYEKLVPVAYGLGPVGVLGPLKRLLVSVLGIFKPVPREPTSRADLKTWAVKSTALACENLMLALRAHGYDSCPMEGLDSHRIRQILSLPRDAVVVMAISAGRRGENGVYGPRVRFDKSQFIREV